MASEPDTRHRAPAVNHPAGPDAVLPNYSGGSIVNLAASLQQHFGVDSGRAPLRDPLPLSDAGLLCLVIVDGLGLGQLRRHLHQGAMPYVDSLVATGQAQVTRLTSVFPSTTAAALSSLYTGLTPSEHGRLGYALSVEGRVVELLGLRDLDSGRPLGDPWAVMKGQSLFLRLTAKGVDCVSLVPEAIADSPLSRWHSAGSRLLRYASPQDLPALLRLTVRGPSPRYLMAYLGDYDLLCHAFGPESKEADRYARYLDRLLRTIRTTLPGKGARLLVTADHGHRSLEPRRAVALQELKGFPEVLLRPPGGERTLRYLMLRPGAEAAAGRLLAGHADLVAARELPFGVPADPGILERVGSHVALPRPGVQLLWRYGSFTEETWRGGHGGLSSQEMEVPLLVL